MQMLIVADDLSGAADCGIACAASDLHTVVLLEDRLGESQADVVAVDADTRWMPPDQAAARISGILEKLGETRPPVLFKKLDSTLRGNVGTELAAALHTMRRFTHAGDRPVVLMAPAFPRNGRTTYAGRQLLHGRYLEDTELWRRERPAIDCYIPRLLQSAGLCSELIPLHSVRAGEHAVGPLIAEQRRHTDVLVCDAETDDDLCTVARASAFIGPNILWAGSAGLAYHLPSALRMRSRSHARTPQPCLPGPVLFVIGSLSSTARSQIETLAAGSDIRRVVVPASILCRGREAPEWLAVERDLQCRIEGGTDMIVTPSSDEAAGLDTGRSLSSALAQMVAPCLSRIGALVSSGGETARAILQSSGISRLQLVLEIEPGVALSVADGWQRPLPVITKAGDFGNPQTLLHCREILRQIRSE